MVHYCEMIQVDEKVLNIVIVILRIIKHQLFEVKETFKRSMKYNKIMNSSTFKIK